MSAIGRAWRRAPAWRFCVLAGAISAAMAAMYPPAGVPMLAHRPAQAPAGTAAHFIPEPAAAPLDGATLSIETGAEARHGVIPFAGRQIPLPPGDWHDVLTVHSGGVIPGQQVALSRIEAGQLTGLMLAVAPAPTAGAAGPLAPPPVCFATNAIIRDMVPENAGQSPMAHECWALVDTDATSAAGRARVDEVMRRALERVEELGAKVPNSMLTVIYVRSSQTGWVNTVLMLPDRADDTAASSHRIQAWVRRFVVALHQGFDSRVTEVVGRDPT